MKAEITIIIFFLCVGLAGAWFHWYFVGHEQLVYKQYGCNTVDSDCYDWATIEPGYHWYNYKTKEYDYHYSTPENLQDYIPQHGAAQNLYLLYV